MKLTRLRLIGFKSFVEPTDVLLEPGLTGIVGPNGCGKSNLVEALRWVMGESSHKAMRAADMDDVIFSGSANRSPRNTAEVSLLIDNQDRTAPAAFNGHDQIEISRRITRELGSTYRVNGREVRARDVQLLFADASTGAHSPALVHQGRIGEIIQAKPQARRRVLEEAAGISGLHVRRHEAELRLKSAEHNLERIEDIIGQLTLQIDGLKRQARQAVRYRNLAAQVRKAEAMLFHLRWLGAQSEVADAARARDLSVRLVAERTAAQVEAARRQDLAAAALPPLREAAAKAGAALHRLTVARETLEREEARAKQRMAELDQRLVQLDADIAREEVRARDAEAAIARLSDEEAALRNEAASRNERATLLTGRISTAEAELAEAERRYAELTGTLADLTARRQQLERAIRENSERLVRLEGQIGEVESELAAIEARGESAVDLGALGAAADAAQRALADAETAMLRAEVSHSSARQELEAKRPPLAEAERRVNRLEAEARTLRKLLHLETEKLWPPVIDLVAVEKGYETALGAALGDDLDAPIDQSAPIRWTGASVDAEDPALPAGAAPLAEHVTAPPELARRLAQIGVVARKDGMRLAAMLRPGQRLVSREGDLWRWDGFSVAAEAPTAAARRLAERNRLVDIGEELAAARAELEGKARAAAAAAAEVAAAEEAEAQARTRWRACQRDAEAAREALSSAEKAASRDATRLSALAEARVRLVASRDETVAVKRSASEALTALAATAGIEEELADIQREVAARRATLAQLRAEAQGHLREAEIGERRLLAIAADAREWAERRTGAVEQIAALQARRAEAKEERARLDDAPAAFAEQRRALITEIEAAERHRRAADDDLAQAESRLADADKSLRAALESVASAREEAARAEERLAGGHRRIEEIGREIREMLEVAPEQVAALAGLAPGAPLADIAAVERDLERLRRERERLGAVNLRAEEELRSVEAQHSNLAAERDDLVEAIKRLRHGIQSLNREARERLLASFEIVNGHFQNLFKKLFGGGNAELQLVDHEDPLEAGLDILAKPPGKRAQTLSLLSGGEQALTALALIFAVFLTNPAPICVLDEVDAPLDDANVERFCDLLDEMIRLTDTRFVTVTHNPITMARMNRLFGVTMAEFGVSQIVSVDLETAERMREAV